MADYKHGSMDTTAQEKVLAGFTTIVSRSIIVIVVALVLLALING
jgi:hypothetical protein